MQLPTAYRWLERVPGPRMILEGIKLFGVHEAPGAAANPSIMAWARETGLQNAYTTDAIAWCGLFMAVVAKRAVKPIPPSPLWALNWRAFGQPSPRPSLGDVLVFQRQGGGHVGLYVGEDPQAFHVLGGNQSDQVDIARVDRSRLFACRRPMYSVQPSNVRPVPLSAAGKLSTNEA